MGRCRAGFSLRPEAFSVDPRRVLEHPLQANACSTSFARAHGLRKNYGYTDPVSKLDLSLDSLLPNRAWARRLSDPANRSTRGLRWAIRIALTILLLSLISTFNVHQHRLLH